MRGVLAFMCVVVGIAVGCGGTKFTSVGDDGGGTSDGSTGDGSTADGGVTSDSGGGDEGGLGLDGGVGTCSGSANLFNNVIKGCTVAGGCVVVFHQIDCCGTKAAVGINHASKDAFDADEAAWLATCPACGCAARPTIAEDGKTAPQMSDFKVACVNNQCRSYVP